MDVPPTSSPLKPQHVAAPLDPLDCDPTRKYVRVIEQRADGLVAFEFSIGWPELAVELMLPGPAFAEFCAAHRVQRLDGTPPSHDPEETRE